MFRSVISLSDKYKLVYSQLAYLASVSDKQQWLYFDRFDIVK